MVELSSTTTATLKLRRSPHGHVSTFPMPSPPCNGDDPTPIASDGLGHAGEAWPGHNAGHLPLGGQRRELPHRPALVLPGTPMGHAVLGVLSSACPPSR